MTPLPRDVIDAMVLTMTKSQSDKMLLLGPMPTKVGWMYRDVSPMPQAAWVALLDLLGAENIEFMGSSSLFLPPAKFCRAQINISPAAQKIWANFLKEHTQ
jgi:hypothetical protein